MKSGPPFEYLREGIFNSTEFLVVMLTVNTVVRRYAYLALAATGLAISFYAATALAVKPTVNRAAKAPLTSDEQKALKDFVRSQHIDDDGVDILTPPVGAIRKDILEQQKQIQQLIEELAGDKLRAKGLRTVVMINSNIDPTAEVEEFSDRSDQQWKGNHPASPAWPIRAWLKMPAGQTFYKITLSVGLLRAAKSRDELAFLVGREIAGILEGPIDSSLELAAKQRKSAIKDQLAIQMMLGRYDLDAALSVVEKLVARAAAKSKASKGKENNAFQSYSSFFENDAHEGVRLGTMETYIEYLRRTDSQARQQSSASLPFVHYEGSAAPANSGHGDFSRRLAAHQAFIEENFVHAFVPKFFTPNSNLNLQNTYSVTAPRAAEFDETLPWFLDELQKVPDLSNQERADRFFGWYSFYRNTNFTDSYQLKLSPHSKIALFGFLKQQMKGVQPWSLLATKKRFRTAIPKNLVSADMFVEEFFENDSTQSVLEAFARIDPDAAKVLAEAELKSSLANSKKRLPVTTALSMYKALSTPLVITDEVRDSTQFKLNATYPLWRGLMRDVVARATTSKAFASTIAASKLELDETYFVAQSSLFELLTNYQLSDSVRASLQNETKSFADDRLALLKRIAKNGFRAADLQILKLAIGARVPAITEAEIDGVAIDLADIAERAVTSGNEPPPADFFSGYDNSDVKLLFGKALASKKLSVQNRENILKYLSSLQPGLLDLADKETADHEFREQIRQAMNLLTPADLLKLVLQPLKPYETYLNKTYSDPTLLALKRKEELAFKELDERVKQARLQTARPQSDVINEIFSSQNMMETNAFSMRPEAGATSTYEDARLNAVLSLLTFAGVDPDVRAKLSGGLSFNDLAKTLNHVGRVAFESHRVEKMWPSVANDRKGPLKLSPSGGLLLFETLFTAGKGQALKDWAPVFVKLSRIATGSLDMEIGLRAKLQQTALDLFSHESQQTRYRYLRQDAFLKLFSTQQLVDILLPYIDARIQPKTSDGKRAAEVVKVLKELDLAKQLPNAFNDIRAKLAEHLHLQPHQIGDYFPESKESWTEQTKAFSLDIRGLSTLVSMTRSQSVEDQIATIDYFMGRRADYPKFLADAAKNLDQGYSVSSLIRGLRDQMDGASTIERTFVANTFLAGPSSAMRTPAHLDKILDHLLGPISDENHELALKLARAELEADGLSNSLAVAYVFAQKATEDGKPMSQGQLLKAVFEARGVPGIKLGQYLAFTGDMKDFRDSLAELQDSAMPLSYFDVLRLVSDRFKGKWPQNLKITTVLGSGSVNVAIEYEDLGTHRFEVVSLLRQDIETTTEEDFLRLQKVVASLNKTPQDRTKFGYLSGLLNIIKKSVELEFNKQNAFDVQTFLHRFYDRKSGRWTIKTLEAYRQENGGLFMEKGQGKTARKIWLTNPDLYIDGMSRLAEIELNGLFGIDESGKPWAVPLVANPDFHDGQVLFDLDTNTITILDFGQALPITNQEREIAIEILRIITQAESESRAQLIVKSITGKSLLSDAEMKDLYQHTDRMDMFVKLIAVLNQKGYDVPLSSVHWILAINRQIALGEKIGHPITAELKRLLVLRKIGLGLNTFNVTNEIGEKLKAIFSKPPAIGRCEDLF